MSKSNFHASLLNHPKFETTRIIIRTLTLLNVCYQSSHTLELHSPKLNPAVYKIEVRVIGVLQSHNLFHFQRKYQGMDEKRGKRRYWARRWRASFESQSLFWWFHLLSVFYFQMYLLQREIVLHSLASFISISHHHKWATFSCAK